MVRTGTSKAFVDFMLTLDDVVDDKVLAKAVADAMDNFQKGLFSKLQVFMILDVVSNKFYEQLEVM